jgi:hypothetical protein
VIHDPCNGCAPVLVVFNHQHMRKYTEEKEKQVNAVNQGGPRRKSYACVFVGGPGEAGFAIDANTGRQRMGMCRTPWDMFRMHADVSNEFFMDDNEKAAALLTFAVHMQTDKRGELHEEFNEFNTIVESLKTDEPSFLGNVANYARGVVDGVY